MLISGASVAGPSVAFWLNRYGFRTTIVEQAPSLRGGGQAVDFRGEQLDVIRRMGLEDAMRARETMMGEQVVVDGRGRTRATLPSVIFSGELELLRGELAQVLHEATRDETEYLFGDRIAALSETADGVDVTFESGLRRTFDLVIGADGLNSGVRRLAFGDAVRRRDLGLYAAGFSMPNVLGLQRQGRIYSEPGRTIYTVSARDSAAGMVYLIFRADEVQLDREDIAAQKEFVATAMAGMGWRVPEILDQLSTADDLFFHRLSQVDMQQYTRGRVALVGDAGWGAGIGGGGTGMAAVGAYVLAGELAEAGGDHTAAFPRYEREMRPFATAGLKQGRGATNGMAPPTTSAIWARNLMFRVLSSRLLSGLWQRQIAGGSRSKTVRDYRLSASTG
ncbi:FAD-dependent oxidoreductase [Pseudonocardiaceae bacterium YIM PH 21723]|nr:FAD-dependent oxidoreductase [Pseudonocardiaceae bacterium YIM PH 21723]